MNQQYALLAAAIILFMASVIHTSSKKPDPMTNHEFMEQVSEFMAAGGRNTAENGMMLCGHINDLAVILDEPELNCEKLYGTDKQTTP